MVTPKKYKVVAVSDLEPDTQHEVEFTDWLDENGKLVCSLDDQISDYFYGFFDKEPYSIVSITECEDE